MPMSKKAEGSVAPLGLAQPGTLWGVSRLGGASCAEVGENYLASDLAGAVRAMDCVNYHLLAALNKVAGPMEYPY